MNCFQCHQQINTKKKQIYFWHPKCNKAHCVWCLMIFIKRQKMNTTKNNERCYWTCCQKYLQNQCMQVFSFFDKNCLICGPQCQGQTFYFQKSQNSSNAHVGVNCYYNTYYKQQRSQLDTKILKKIQQYVLIQCQSCSKKNVDSILYLKEQFKICNECKKQSKQLLQNIKSCMQCGQKQLFRNQKKFMFINTKIVQLDLFQQKIQNKSNYYCYYCYFQKYLKLEDKTTQIKKQSTLALYFKDKKNFQEVFRDHCIICGLNSEAKQNVYKLNFPQFKHYIYVFICCKCYDHCAKSYTKYVSVQKLRKLLDNFNWNRPNLVKQQINLSFINKEKLEQLAQKLIKQLSQSKGSVSKSNKTQNSLISETNKFDKEEDIDQTSSKKASHGSTIFQNDDRRQVNKQYGKGIHFNYPNKRKQQSSLLENNQSHSKIKHNFDEFQDCQQFKQVISSVIEQKNRESMNNKGQQEEQFYQIGSKQKSGGQRTYNRKQLFNAIYEMRQSQQNADYSSLVQNYTQYQVAAVDKVEDQVEDKTGAKFADRKAKRAQTKGNMKSIILDDDYQQGQQQRVQQQSRIKTQSEQANKNTNDGKTFQKSNLPTATTCTTIKTPPVNNCSQTISANCTPPNIKNITQPSSSSPSNTNTSLTTNTPKINHPHTQSPPPTTITFQLIVDQQLRKPLFTTKQQIQEFQQHLIKQLLREEQQQRKQFEEQLMEEVKKKELKKKEVKKEGLKQNKTNSNNNNNTVTNSNSNSNNYSNSNNQLQHQQHQQHQQNQQQNPNLPLLHIQTQHLQLLPCQIPQCRNQQYFLNMSIMCQQCFIKYLMGQLEDGQKEQVQRLVKDINQQNRVQYQKKQERNRLMKRQMRQRRQMGQMKQRGQQSYGKNQNFNSRNNQGSSSSYDRNISSSSSVGINSRSKQNKKTTL